MNVKAEIKNNGFIAAIAMVVVTLLANSTCAFIAHQAEMPEGAKKLRNKPLDEIEHRVYKKRAVIIAAAEIAVSVVFKLTSLNSLFAAVVFSFAVLCFMLVVGKVKNIRLKPEEHFF